jgi:hypothetical protein
MILLYRFQQRSTLTLEVTAKFQDKDVVLSRACASRLPSDPVRIVTGGGNEIFALGSSNSIDDRITRKPIRKAVADLIESLQKD